ncbi:PREDICTED: mucin-17-like [Cyprinodon variegatus]|uniref:Mucin-17-like n=1 Tax=Cyprinodon variegatus TaxID=28743 RepID=A0A3Q2CLP1_CYPVA|nr:PREDICTED: mucin-17-like [Cyprinodon variegatus]XP_015236630.1 PREDICTED: mucin-17-like [Cyprinodon variegatus]XP_015236631.1 PREDICTED: mucin-17-like [Cyprinodon variegatus]XP_015236633.1 PREDICTED: mucin-17-like [Cyprinodon variegatus]
MDSQLASVLTSGSLKVQNGSQCAEAQEPVTKVVLDQKDKKFPPSTKPGNLKSGSVRAAVAIIRRDAQSVNREQPEVGGTSEPVSQETSKIAGIGQPITAKHGVPVLGKQPIRIRIVVPPECNRPMINCAFSPTKDTSGSQFSETLISAERDFTENNREQVPISASQKKEEISGDATAERNVKITQMDGSDSDLISNTDTVKVLSHLWIKEEPTEKSVEHNIPLMIQEMNTRSFRTFSEAEMEEQMEPLDLSLPKTKEKIYGRFLEDPGCASPLIMEVDEFEGDGDRDMVEGDSDEGSVDFSTCVLKSLSSGEDNENLLLIDDQGIPYTLSPDGLKVPQIDASILGGHQSDQVHLIQKEEEDGSSDLAGPSYSQSLENALDAPGDFPASDLSPQGSDTLNLMTNSDTSVTVEVNVKDTQEAKTAVTPLSGISLSSQTIQILTNPSTSAPLLLLSSSSPQLSSPPVGLSLPLSVTSPGASTPMLLLLSSVPSTSTDSTSTSTPIAVLDPSTGQLSQVTATSGQVSLPLSSGQVNALGSPLSNFSNPVIRLDPSNSPLILSGVDSMASGPVLTSLTVPSPTVCLQDSSLSTAIQTQICYSQSNPGSEAISNEEVTSENNKPSSFAATSAQSHSPTCDPTILHPSEAEAQLPSSELKFGSSDFHSEHLPLDDHLYFSNATAPPPPSPSPPIGPLLPSGKLDSLDALDPLSPAESPTNLGPRRVLCCQLCPRIFFYLSDLERHAITHSQKKPHVCQQCGKAFKRSSHLQRHKHIHTGQRNFVCPICTKRFREAGELQRHQRVHTGEKPYQCQLCHTRFAERNTLRRHTKRKHPFHQVAVEMLNEKKDRGDRAGGAGRGGAQEEEESAEWYSSTVSTLDNSESEVDTAN